MSLKALRKKLKNDFGDALIGATFLDKNNTIHVLFDKSEEGKDLTEYRDINIYPFAKGKVKIYYKGIYAPFFIALQKS